jgi:Trypsin
LRVAGLFLILIAALALPAALALGEEPGYQAPPEAASPAGVGSTDAAGDPTVIGGGPRAAVMPKRRTATVRTCVLQGRVRTCRFHRGVTIAKTCVTRPGKKVRCTAGTATTGRTRGGFEQAPGLAVGRSYLHDRSINRTPFDGWCSGALIGPGLFLTAAHCLYDNGPRKRGFSAADMTVILGNTIDSRGRPTSSHGVWNVIQNYVPLGWQQGDRGLDWGIQVIAPDSRGRYPGQVTGTFAAHAGITLDPGARIHVDGYPAAGIFHTAAHYFGSDQYSYDGPFDGAGSWQVGTPENGLDSGTWVYFPSEMTGGSSGAPVFTRFADGTWGIFGVVNRGVDTRAQNRPNFVGRSQLTIMLDDRFVSFFNSVVGLVRAMPRGRGAAGPFEISRATDAMAVGGR